MIKLERKEDCCGCSACENICGTKAIQLKSDEEGFLYPIINVAKCVDCNLCEKVCPIISHKENNSNETKQSYFALRLKNKNTLFQSSSGGAFSAFAEYVLNNGGYVAGATFDSSMVVRHIIIHYTKDLWKLRGSKYVQSDVSGIYSQVKELLKGGNTVLFVGTPCQIEGLKQFLRKDYQNLLTIDLLCHAVASPLLFKEYVSYLEKKIKTKVTWMNMRDKSLSGWSSHYSLCIYLSGGKKIFVKNQLYPWIGIYGSGLIYRPSCHECKFANLERPGDVSIGDFWDFDKLRSDIYSPDGTSVCLVNTQNGEDIINSVKRDVQIWKLSQEESIQPCLQFPVKANVNRDLFWQYFHKYGFVKAYKEFLYISKPIRFIWCIKSKIANFIHYNKKSSML